MMPLIISLSSTTGGDAPTRSIWTGGSIDQSRKHPGRSFIGRIGKPTRTSKRGERDPSAGATTKPGTRTPREPARTDAGTTTSRTGGAGGGDDTGSQLTDVVSSTTDGDGYCAMLSTGAMYCWAYNAGGELGNGTINGSDGAYGYDTPQAVSSS